MAGPEQLSGKQPANSMTSATTLELPEVSLTNHLGESVKLHELLAGKVVVIQTMFTTCGTICPPMGANFSRLQALLDGAPDVALLSISVDPVTDTPERLRAWGEKFGAGPGWTLLTGSTSEIRRTLEALRVYAGEPEQHTSMVVIGNPDADRWTRVDGLSDPPTLLAQIDAMREPAAPAPTPSSPEDNAAHAYFTDVELVDQHGRTHRLYSDLLHGKVVMINSFFTSCAGVCPPMIQRIAELQAPLAEHLGRDLWFLSLTVDPITDTQAELAAYAKKFGAGEGWLFLGGDKQDVERALLKLGFAVEVREGHSNLVVIGNDNTGLWKKAFALSAPEDLLAVVRSVLDDPGPQADEPGPSGGAGPAPAVAQAHAP